MSVTITQNQFDGGIASDVRTHSANQCADSVNFDVFTNPYKLIPYRQMISETDGSNTIADTKISNVGQTVIGNTEFMVAFGRISPLDNKIGAYTRTANQLNGAWSLQATGVAGYSYVPNSYLQYNGVSYALGTNNSSPLTVSLQKYTGAGNMILIDTFTYTLPAGVSSIPNVPKPFIHPSDNRMYIAAGNVLAVWDGVSGAFIDVPGLLPTGFVVTGITHFGDNLAIAMSPIFGQEESIICIWDRDYVNHATYLSSVIRCGTGRIDTMANLDGNLAVIMSSLNTTIELENYLMCKLYSGGQVELVVELKGINTFSNQSIISVKKDNKIYFARSADNAIYCFGKNKQGRYILTHDYLVKAGGINFTSSPSDYISNLVGLSFVGGCLYVGYIGYDNVYRLMATKGDLATYTSPSTYITTINPNMPIVDRNKMKRLISVKILFSNATSGNCKLEYAVNGDSNFILIDNHDMTDLKNLINTSAEDGGVPFATSRDFQFRITCTNGASILGISYEYESVPEL